MEKAIDFLFRRRSSQYSELEAMEEDIMMLYEQVDLCGFLDAKIPVSNCVTPKIKKLPLNKSKFWRKYWITFAKPEANMDIEVILDSGVVNGIDFSISNEKRTCVRLPTDAKVCRVESKSRKYAFAIISSTDRKPLLYLSANSEIESQNFMAKLRQVIRPRRQPISEGSHFVSIIDNAHSKSVGMTGLYGDLISNHIGVFIKDVQSGDVLTRFQWSEIHNFHLASSGRIDDVKCICVINTTKEFRGGVGQLNFYCTEADKLLKNLVLEGRLPKRRHTIGRPLSLSEGDLRQLVITAGKPHCVIIKGSTTTPNTGLTLSGSTDKVLSGNSNKLEQMFQFPTQCPIQRRRAVDNEYLAEPENDAMRRFGSPRRISNISDSSGIYEEIDEHRFGSVDSNDSVLMNMHVYQDPDEIFLSNKFNLPPPPLPPRPRCGSTSTRFESISDDGFDSEGCTRSATPTTISDDTPPSFEEKSESRRAEKKESEYVVMSPQFSDIELIRIQQEQNKFQEEELYMVMR